MTSEATLIFLFLFSKHLKKSKRIKLTAKHKKKKKTQYNGLLSVPQRVTDLIEGLKITSALGYFNHRHEN